jgi:hypothetical protein
MLLVKFHVLHLETFEWGYVGESGAEIIPRNAHSMGILAEEERSDESSEEKEQHQQQHYLVVYGGASPELGPLGDTVYAALPDASSIGIYDSGCSVLLLSFLFAVVVVVILLIV